MPSWAESGAKVHKVYHHPGYGFDSGDSPISSGGNFKRCRIQSELFRRLTKVGIFTRGNINYAKSGATAATAATKIAEMFAAGHRPKIIACLIGTNDAATIGSTATFESNYQSIITTAYNNGCKGLAALTIPSLEGNPSYQSKPYRDKVDELNGVVASLPAWAESQGYGAGFVKGGDGFNAFGGHEIDTSEFQTNNVHPNEKGSGKLGHAMSWPVIRLISQSL